MADMGFALRNGRVIDPASGVDQVADLYIHEGRVVDSAPTSAVEVDCAGMMVAPGFVDLYGRLADLVADSRAATAGGYVLAVACPDVGQPHHNPKLVQNALHRARSVAHLRIELAGAVTHGLEGESLAPMGSLLDAGCVALSNGSEPVSDPRVLSSILEYGGRFGRPIMLRGAEAALEIGGVVGEGAESVRLGLPAVPPESEEIGIYRLAALARRAGTPVHVSHVWSRRGVDALRRVRADGVGITASTTPHHVGLYDEIIHRLSYSGTCRLQPPLGTLDDRAAVRDAVLDGTIDAVATDHRPLPPHAQDTPLSRAKPGAIAYETALPLLLGVTDDLGAVVRALSVGPRRVLGEVHHGLTVGAPADVVIFDPSRRWTVGEDTLHSSERNTPMWGLDLTGRVSKTILGGVLTHPC